MANLPVKKSYKDKFDFAKRKLESDKVRKKYPDKIPIIVVVSDKCDDLELEKNKYLCPSDLTCGQFIYVIRKRTKLTPEQALFIFVNNTIPATAAMLGQIYKEHCDKDGFLYMVISKESTFG